jgi:hypothetical protein
MATATATVSLDDILDLARSLDPVLLAEDAGFELDPWQQEVLRSDAPRLLLCCSRQAGKSTIAALLALHQALYCPDSLVLLLAPVQRQAGELFRKLMAAYRALGCPVPSLAETALTLELVNGSRIVALPGEEANIRCYSGVSLLVIDEAARVDDALYQACRPFLAVSKGRLLALSTPFGKRGWYYSEWHGDGDWQRVEVKASDCPRISPAFLAEERAALGDRWFRQEYEISFEDTVDAVFSSTEVQAALVDGLPLFAPCPP